MGVFWPSVFCFVALHIGSLQSLKDAGGEEGPSLQGQARGRLVYSISNKLLGIIYLFIHHCKPLSLHVCTSLVQAKGVLINRK